MSRAEGKFSASEDAALELSDLLAALGASAGGKGADAWREAIACYLSGGDGWREAGRRLGGAFADERPDVKDGKL